ncbi:RIE1 [Symbiodinium natans]|uniref:RING-type E3 ubiquitin transferase n=1 Tax=Symbiodinium natans TaxID=878477 RepID=A0A812QLT8_9DINO|nr:RIE1 [Symbiodinium natans]
MQLYRGRQMSAGLPEMASMVPAMWRSASCEDLALMNTAAPPDDVERSRILKVVQGTWINVDCPAERYTVVGHHVTRNDVQGCRHFTLFWDPRRKQLQWGTQGRLYLACLGDGMVAWVPSRYCSRAWRWQRVAAPGMPPHSMPPQWTPLPCQGLSACPVPVDTAMGTYGPWRRPYGAALRSWAPGYAGGRPSDFPPRRSHWHYGYAGRGFHGNRSIQGMNLERDSRLACGLSSSEVFDLLFRDITPDDYETLLRLDESVSRPTASTSCINNLKKVPGKDLLGEVCSVCLAAFDDNDVAAALPCGHHFHFDCVSKWLGECRSACPLCGENIGAVSVGTEAKSGREELLPERSSASTDRA